MHKPKAVIMADDVPWYDGNVIDYIYGAQRIETIRALTDLHPVRITSDNLDAELPDLADLEVIFSCWGMLRLSPEQLDKLSNLKAVFYAGGSVNGFAGPYLERGITVCSGVDANAIPVAEFCLAQILLALKDYWTNTADCRKGPWEQSKMQVGKGAYGETVALLGIGAISRHLLALLKPFNLRIIAVSGYLAGKPEEAKAMGIDQLVTIEEAFREGYVVSNHLPDKESNRGVLSRNHFASMRRDATFINTGRGAQVDEAGMIEVLKQRTDLTALLDVQHPEPPEADSELFTLPNVHMTSHIAGSTNDEVQRMADFVLDDFQRWTNGEALRYAVAPGTLAGRA
jgi:phosphoglycerate dehydrogenase-like enzyme